MTKKKKKLLELEGISMSEDSFSLSLGEMLGKPPGRDQKAPLPQKEHPKPGENHPRGFSKVVLQRTSSGRGGKWVVRVLLTPQPAPPQLEALARDLRRSLGTGAHVEGNALIVQGDISERVGTWFRKQGAARVIL